MNLSSINPLRAGSIGVLLIAAALLAAIFVPRVTFDANTHEYTADFVNASGLQNGSQVYVAGVPSGRVTDLEIEGDHVAAHFRLDRDQQLGIRTTAEIKIQTVLGRRYIAVRPAGTTPMRSGDTIPASRTSVPFDVGSLARSASSTAGSLDIQAMQDAISTLRGNLPTDPKLIGDTLSGVTGVSKMVAERNDQFQKLLRGAKSVTDVLVGQRKNLKELLGNAKVVAEYLVQQRDAISTLLTVTNKLIGQVSQLIKDNEAKVDPLLTNLVTLADGLKKHQSLLAEALKNLHDGSKNLANATGNGPWIDFAVPGILLPDNVDCVLGLVKGCK
ncbi:MCE family protein [Sciscionella marina]|uniref:MCE family protein n=1 Tax=Sciscionella marina TaxID=508770 RepID=UPI0003A0539C|nr:MCE family protein [Sciscionella marina]